MLFPNNYPVTVLSGAFSLQFVDSGRKSGDGLPELELKIKKIDKDFEGITIEVIHRKDLQHPNSVTKIINCEDGKTYIFTDSANKKFIISRFPKF